MPTLCPPGWRLADLHDLLLSAEATQSRPERCGFGEYEARPDGLYRVTVVRGQIIDQRLANFTAVIVRQIRFSDGAEDELRFEIRARLNGRTTTFCLPAALFVALGWVSEVLGAEAYVASGKRRRSGRYRRPILPPQPLPRPNLDTGGLPASR